MEDRRQLNMNQIVGVYDILFVCMDSLRLDVALEEEQNNGTPVLNSYGKWRSCQAPGNFTYPSHQAMFAGFLPIDEGVLDMKNREKLFFSQDIGMGRKAPEGAYNFKTPTWIQALAQEGYETHCIGGVSFFDKRTEMGRVLPGYFSHSCWHPSFGCKVKDSAAHQVDQAVKILDVTEKNQRLMMYINFSALHYPNFFYLEGAKRDSVESHRMALRYVDGELGRLFARFKQKGNTFVICCSDHGTCYGEDGVWYHGINHPVVNAVPYKHFFIL